MAVRAKEIAQKLNISPATVSLVLRNKPGISDITRQRVLEAAAEMGYRRELNAPASRKHIHLVYYKKHGHVVGDTEFFSQLTQSIDAEAKKLGYELIMTYFYESQSIYEQLHSLEQENCVGI